MGSALAKPFIDRLVSVVGDRGGGLHEPMFVGNEKKYLEQCVDEGFVSSVGAFVGRFEEQLADFVGAKHAVAAVNGTSALHLALVAVGVRPGDEVFVPALSFVATANAVVLAGAIPHFVDVSEGTWGIDPDALRTLLDGHFRSDGGRLVNQDTGRTVSAVIPMHTLGHPCDANGIRGIADRYALAMVEDAAESLGSYLEGEHTGTVGHAGVVSFNGNKTITTGGGGAVVTNDNELAARMRHLSTTAKIPHRFEFDHDQAGFNYRMPNINAALGVAQLEVLPMLLANQRELLRLYQNAFQGFQAGSLRVERANTTSNYWLHAFVLEPSKSTRRDEIIEACLDAGLAVRPLWKPLDSLSPFSVSPRKDATVAKDLYSRTICLPSSASIVA